MKLWGGRFTENTNELMERFNASIGFDQKLYVEDIEGSVAHAKMLEKIGILSLEERNQLIAGLRALQVEIETGEADLKISNEDIHMNIEALLVEKVGDLGKKLHTARSRNDQVAVDLRLYSKKAATNIILGIEELMNAIIAISEDNLTTIMPGYTHLQRAQPITLAYHLMAYCEMFSRDVDRFKDMMGRMDVMPLGSGALAGVNYETDREFLKSELGFAEISMNAMDAVSDRDFVIEFQSAAAILMMHLSRFSEEIILWASSEFGFIELSDQFSTGSSIMPQKKNPDAAELIRGKTGRIYGNLMGILTVMKGLPLAYNKDMQEDKEGLFDTVETLEICIAVFTKMIETAKFNKNLMGQAVKEGYLNATDFADYLVSKGISFRDAHEISGRVTRDCIDQKIPIEEMPLEALQKYAPVIEASVYEALDPLVSIEKKKSMGSTKTESVKAHLEKMKLLLQSGYK